MVRQIGYEPEIYHYNNIVVFISDNGNTEELELLGCYIVACLLNLLIQNKEICTPNQFYAAYIFDQAESHQKDVTTILEESGRLGYPVRYWWLSQAMDIQGYSDSLIVCVHHPTNDENAGMDLYEILKNRQVSFDELNAATLDEYICLGQKIDNAIGIQRRGKPIY